MAILKHQDEYKAFEEMHRITKSKGVGITGPFEEKMGLLPFEPQKRRWLKYLANKAIEIGTEKDENDWHLILPPSEETLQIHDNIKRILDVPTKNILKTFGLKVTEKLTMNPFIGKTVYYYTWKKGKPVKMKGERILKTDFDNLEHLFKDLQKIDVD